MSVVLGGGKMAKPSRKDKQVMFAEETPGSKSLDEINGSIAVPKDAGF